MQSLLSLVACGAALLVHCVAEVNVKLALKHGDTESIISYPEAINVDSQGLLQLTLDIGDAEIEPRIIQLSLKPRTRAIGAQPLVVDMLYKPAKKQASTVVNFDNFLPEFTFDSQYDLRLLIADSLGKDPVDWFIGTWSMAEAPAKKDQEDAFYIKPDFRDARLFSEPMRKATAPYMIAIMMLVLLLPFLVFSVLWSRIAKPSSKSVLLGNVNVRMFMLSLVMFYVVILASWYRYDIFKTMQTATVTGAISIYVGFRYFRSTVLEDGGKEKVE